jgi:hypothetical protein
MIRRLCLTVMYDLPLLASRRPDALVLSAMDCGLNGCESMVSKSARASQFKRGQRSVLPAELVRRPRLRYYYIIFKQLRDIHH